MSRSEKLREALELVGEIRKTLQSERTHCECCGLAKYANHNEFKIDQALEAAASRIRKAAEQIEVLDKKP